MQWPREEADRLIKRFNSCPPKKGYVLFETGYGPSGLPHLGTFSEVARTAMVRFAFSQISNIPTRLFAFSDDMDGLRKVPTNVPKQEMLQKHIGKSLTSIPDPFEKYESFGHHNNAMLCNFLNDFGFEFEFQSSTDWYKSRRFDNYLRLVLENYEKIMEIMLPSLRDERKATYSPFLPICPRTGIVLQVKMDELKKDDGTIVYKDPETNQFVETKVTGGNCKLQWKVDLAMRWAALDVDYEMSGKDLIDTVKLSTKICKVLGKEPPETLIYEHFLDDLGQKISKSKGNGMTIDEWLEYAPKESLSYFIYQSPKRAKRLYFDVIPRSVDEYMRLRRAEITDENPLFYIHEGKVPKPEESEIPFTLLLNVASVCNADTDDVLFEFVKRYNSKISKETHPFLMKLVSFSRKYAKNFVKKDYKIPNDTEKAALIELKEAFLNLYDQSEEQIQAIAFEVGKKHYAVLKDWFSLFYKVLLGQSDGPRIGSFVYLLGIDKTCNLIDEKCA